MFPRFIGSFALGVGLAATSTAWAGPGLFDAAVDIGAPLARGSTTLNGTTYTLKGAGADVWDGGDQFHFAYKRVAGDFVATLHVRTRSTSPAGAGQWGRHGLMARWSTAASSKYSLLATLLPTVDFPRAAHRPFYQFRMTHLQNGGNRANYWAEDGTFPIEGRLPAWMRLIRIGRAVYGYMSEDAGGRPREWVFVGSDSAFDMPEVLLVGAFLHSQAEGILGTMTFDNMTIEPLLAPPEPPCERGETFAGTDFNNKFGLLSDRAHTASGSGAFWPGFANGRLRLSQDGVLNSAGAVWYDLPGSAALTRSGFIAEFDAFVTKAGLPGDVNPADGMTIAVVQGGAELLGIGGELCTCPAGCSLKTIGSLCSVSPGYDCPNLYISCEGGRIGPGGDAFTWLTRDVTGDFDFAVQLDPRQVPHTSFASISGIMARYNDDPKSRFTMAQRIVGSGLSQAGRTEHLGAGEAGYYGVALDPNALHALRSDLLRLTRRGNVLQAWGSSLEGLADGSLDPRDDSNWTPGSPDDWGPNAPATLAVGFATSYDVCGLGKQFVVFRQLGTGGLVGGEGGDLGFGGGRLRDHTEGHPSFAVEMDNWVGGGEPGNDPSDGGAPDFDGRYHFGLDVNAEVTSIATNDDIGIPSVSLPDIFDPRGIHVQVRYSPAGRVDVFANSNFPPFFPHHMISTRIPPLAGPILIGFTAATGGGTSTQDIDNFIVTELKSCAATGGAQMPGDCNQDGGLDISDAICLLGHLFLGAPARLPCDEGAVRDPGNVSLLDSNGDAAVDLSDAVRVLGFLFGGSAPPVLGTERISIPGCPDNLKAL